MIQLDRLIRKLDACGQAGSIFPFRDRIFDKAISLVIPEVATFQMELQSHLRFSNN
jgi:hypothetical protein